METIITFLGTHWIWFLVIAILLVFALIGYIVDSNSIEEDRHETMSVGDLTNKVEEVETLSTVSEPVNQEVSEPVNQEPTTTSQTAETLDTNPQEEVLDVPTDDATPVQSAPQEQTKQLIEENISTESTFQE